MNRFAIIVTSCLIFAASAFAQEEKIAPGIYAVVDSTYTHLTYTPGVSHQGGVSILSVEVGHSQYTYKGASSGVKAVDRFIMVVDPASRALIKTPKRYNPFFKDMNPNLIIIVPLDIQKGKRIYDEGASVQGFNTKKKDRIPFEWELVDENTFEIRTAPLSPGEYAFVFKPAKLGVYDFCSIYGFFISEETSATESATESEIETNVNGTNGNETGDTE